MAPFHCLWPWVKQSIMAEGCGGVELLSDWQLRHTGRDRKGSGTRWPLSCKAMPPETCSLQPGSISCHLPIMPSNHDSISGSIHQWGQSPNWIHQLQTNSPANEPSREPSSPNHNSLFRILGWQWFQYFEDTLPYCLPSSLREVSCQLYFCPIKVFFTSWLRMFSLSLFFTSLAIVT